MLQRFHDVVVGRLITEVHAQNSLEAFKEIRRYHIEKLTGVVLFETLLKVILEGLILPLELLLKVRPGQLAPIDQVDQDIEGSFNIIPSRFVVSST